MLHLRLQVDSSDLKWKIELRRSSIYWSQPVNLQFRMRVQWIMYFKNLTKLHHSLRTNIEYPEIVTQKIVDYLNTSQHVLESRQRPGTDTATNTIFVKQKRGPRSFQIPKTSLQILIDYNFSQQHIARMIGVSARTINRRLKEHDIKPKTYSNITEIELDAIVRTSLLVKISSVKKIRRLNVTKFFYDFVTFHRRNFLTSFSDREENNFYICFISFVFGFNIKLI